MADPLKDFMKQAAPRKKNIIRKTTQGEAGFDNPRENIDPRIITKAIISKEGSIQSAPVNAKDIVNKEYADSISGSPAGSDGEVQFNNAGSFGADSSHFWDNTNKRLGIGTATPRSELHIAGTGSIILASGSGSGTATISDATTSIKVSPNAGSLTQYSSGIGFNHLFNYGGSTAYDAWNTAWIGLKYNSGAGNTDARLVFATRTTAMTQPVEKMTIMPDGKVGIGDTAPNQKLGIKGTNAQISIEESNTEFLRIGVGETAGTAVIGWDDSDTLRLGVYSSPTDTTITTRMSISNAGAVNLVSVTATGNINTGSSGKIFSATQNVSMLIAETSFIVTSNCVQLTGEPFGNNLSTITGGNDGMLLTIRCFDNLVIFVDGVGADAINLQGGANLVGVADLILQLVYTNGQWYEVSRCQT